MALSATAVATDTVNLPTATVTAPAKTKVELLPLDVTMINSETIERSAETSLLPIMVSNVPGLFVTERGFMGYGVSGGSAGAVNIRGVGQGNKVLFLIDGQPQWAGVFGHSLPDTYVTNGVERVEVVKGPSSLLYGSNAMGGSVNIITRRQTRDGVFGSARAMFGSFSTQKFAVSTGVKKGKFSATVAGQVDRSNGNREGSEFWLANEFMQVQYDASDNWQTGGERGYVSRHMPIIRVLPKVRCLACGPVCSAVRRQYTPKTVMTVSTGVYRLISTGAETRLTTAMHPVPLRVIICLIRPTITWVSRFIRP